MQSLPERLWLSRRDGKIMFVNGNETPKTIGEAIAIQHAAIKCARMPTVGFKVGSTSAEAQKILKTNEPGASLLLSGFFRTSPATIPVATAHEPAVEAEFALRLGKDLPPRGKAYSFEDVLQAIDGIAGAIEVVGSRLAGGLAGKGRLLTTMDFGANIALVIGKIFPFQEILNLAAHEVYLSINGTLHDKGFGARALGNPINVVKWLANSASQTRRGLFKGEIISTGTCTGVLAVSPGDRVIANFGDLNTVEINFKAMEGL